MEYTNFKFSNNISKRRPIHAVSEEMKSLPCSLVVPEPTSRKLVDNEITKKGEVIQEFSKDLYVFGKAPDNGGFKFSKLFGEVGSTIKRFLGFRN